MEEEKKNKRKAVILMIVGVIILIGLVVGATYAYFSAQVGTGDKAQINAKAGTTDDLTFATTGPITITANQTNFAEGENSLYSSATATAHLIAGDDDNTATEHYYLYLQIDANNLTYTVGKDQPELIMEITDPNEQPYTEPIEGLEYKENITDGKGISYSGYDITEAKGLFAIAKNYEIIASPDKTDTWTIKVTFLNLATDQHENTDKTLTGKLIIQKEELISQDMKNVNQLLADANKDTITLYFHNAELEGGAQDDSYRYAGSFEEVKNYVCLDGGTTTTGTCESDDDLYRIIGLFKNDENKYEMKLIKYDYATSTQLGDEGAYESKYSLSTSLPSYKGNKENIVNISIYNWTSHYNGVNDWTNSELRKTNLNDYYLNTYLKETKHIDIDNLITTHIWNVNGCDFESKPKDMFNSEMNKTIENKIGLMYASDYGYAANPNSTNNWDTPVDNYKYDNIPDNNWVYMGIGEWTISRISFSSSGAIYIVSSGSLEYDSVDDHPNAVRPSFYLSSDTKIKNGDGTHDNPYRLALD